MERGWVYVAVGGALGAVGRYLLAIGSARLLGPGWPWGTLLANWVGCLLIGLLFGLGVERAMLPPALRLLFLTGFLGAFTTFSTYALETVQLLREERLIAAAGNLLANNLGGLLLVVLGLWGAGALGR
ncbi:MAG: hypothetical protein KatS3mg115_2610 [Candidatus Poribacteria bacterium]|nr:MAG: hypothetical protein KatS3mg115_2610 [Candidatus Poribacteria bacterium]